MRVAVIPDPIELAIFKSSLHSIAEEMGAALRRTAYSPNIKERRDYSSALFDAGGQVISMGDDMPVHLGSMPMSVRAALAKLTLEEGDIAILNDPYAGGTHLPDITLVIPIFVAGMQRAAFFAANRAHHADVGGMYPGSMGLCREIWQEGIRIPPVKLVAAGVLNHALLQLILNNVRTPREREGDLTAQIGACRIGAERVREMVEKYGLDRVQRNVQALMGHSEELMRSELALFPDGEFAAEDFLDSDGLTDQPVKICVTLRTNPSQRSLQVDFSGSGPQIATSLNAVAAITYSATFYVLRCLLPEEAAATAGLMRPVELILPEGSVVNAKLPAAVAGGNVETSQRITDVLLRAFAKMIPDHEQPDHWRRGSARRSVVRILRNNCGWVGRATQRRWRIWRPYPHDEFAQHAGRSAGVRVPFSRSQLWLPKAFRRPGGVSWRRWHHPRD